MKRNLPGLVVFLALFAFASPSFAEQSCFTLKSGTLMYAAGHYLAGQPITTGVNPYGYNYQAHMFNGTYFNSYAGPAGFPPYDGDDATYLAANPAAAAHWAWPYRNDELAMKWNEAWLGNKDCDFDGMLDSHFGFTTYIGSGAWLTNHQKGTYFADGEEQSWTYFTKIVAAPPDASSIGGNWVTLDNSVIGPAVWGEFATIQQVYNDTGTGDHGLYYVSPYSAGVGRFGPR